MNEFYICTYSNLLCTLVSPVTSSVTLLLLIPVLLSADDVSSGYEWLISLHFHKIQACFFFPDRFPQILSKQFLLCPQTCRAVPQCLLFMPVVYYIMIFSICSYMMLFISDFEISFLISVVTAMYLVKLFSPL